ncbi:MAG: hypothetical protein LBV54_02580, partial [Puniceicoccales bacterium]|nr:hypothetical protein [Puniceicoccales bacterium]
MHIRRFSLFITLFSLFAMFTPAAVFADAAADLKNVQKAREDGQPKTALTLVEPLIAAALTAQDYDIALAAILEKATISAVIERRGGEAAAIRILTPYFESAPLALKPMLAAALAHAWQRYYDHHHWDLLHRSRAQDDSADFLTWDATRVRAEIRRYYTLALADTAALQRTPVTAFGTFLACDANREPAFRPDALRPTLYDFLVHDAIDFHSLGEQGITQAEDHFQPAADSPLLGSLEEFLDWKPQTNDTDSAALHAIRLFQDVLRFHLNDTSPLALSDADLQRILWAGKTLSRSTDTDARVEHALRAHIKRWQSEETASDAAAELSSLLREKNPLEAYKVAVQGLALHPSSAAAARCRSLIAQIEDPQLDSIKTESVWNASTPEIAIQYRNIETIHFRAVAADWQEFLASKRNRPDSLNAAEFAALLKKNPVKTWQVALPKTADYVMRTHRVDAPDDLAPGFYFIIASVSEKFSPKKNAIIYTTAWVSDLALLFGGEPALGASGRLEGLVLNAITGEPVPDATVTGWYLRHSKSGGERVKLQVAKTDATGAFSIHSPNREDTLLLAEGPGGHSISSDAASSYANYRSPSAAPERTRYYIRFFTDRAIYRPGQSIQFKAVVFTANRDTNQYAIAAGRKIAVVLDDPNRKEAARLELRTNGYGTASGSFIVPPGRINGSYTFHTVGAENGRSTIQIEEYKRPKFEVLLAAPATPPKLDAPVTLTGTATAYTGAPVDGAKVEWKVMRTAQWPRWCWWRVPTAGRAIAHGTAATDASGKFTIQFTAEPDKATDPKDEPRFNYQITADVTDATGETRVGIRRVAIGYAAINAEIAVGAWQTSDAPVALKVSTASLDGEPREATGQLVIYALRLPAKVIRSKLLSYRDWDSDGEAESEKHPGDSRTWAEGDSIFTHSFTTDATGIGTLHAKLPVGIYRAVLTTADNFGQPVRARTEITVADPAATRGAVRVPFAFNVEKNEFQPGDTFAALWSSGYDTARALVSIKHRGKTLQRFWTDPARTQQKIAFPVTEELRGGFTVQIAQVRENRFYKQERKIDVPWSNKELNLGWERFNSKLVPGGRETWTLRIKNPNAAGPSPVELAATLYDVSLDQFAPHTWGNLRGIFYNENYSSSINFANAWKAGIGKVNDLVDTKGRVSTFMGSYRSWPSGDPNPVALSSVASHDGIAPSANRAASAVGGTSPELEVKAP